MHTRCRDGVYTNDFTVLEPHGAVKKWTEYGIWGVRAPIYFTAMSGFLEDGEQRPIDATDAPAYDAYRIDFLDANVFRYTSHTSGTTFELTKIEEDLEAPQQLALC